MGIVERLAEAVSTLVGTRTRATRVIGRMPYQLGHPPWSQDHSWQIGGLQLTGMLGVLSWKNQKSSTRWVKGNFASTIAGPADAESTIKTDTSGGSRIIEHMHHT